MRRQWFEISHIYLALYVDVCAGLKKRLYHGEMTSISSPHECGALLFASIWWMFSQEWRSVNKITTTTPTKMGGRGRPKVDFGATTNNSLNSDKLTSRLSFFN